MKLRISLLALASLSIFSTTSFANGFAQCLDFFANKTPPKVSTKTAQVPRELCFTSFAILHSGQSKTPIFSVEKLNKASLADAKGEERTNKFYEEARLPSAERAKLSDYAKSNYDRGHQAPAADMPNPESMAQSFSLANMVPQAPTSNRKIWAGLEKATRKFAERASGDVFVYTGPVFQTQPPKTIGENKVWIPTHLYKLVYDSANNRAWAYWVENTNEFQIKGDPRISYQELVKRVGIEFLPGKNPNFPQ